MIASPSPLKLTHLLTTPFHLSFPNADLEKAELFYVHVLGGKVKRRHPTSTHIDCFGHQITIHHLPGYDARNFHVSVDAEDVPVPHFGFAFTLPEYQEIVERALTAFREQLVPFQIVLQSHVRFVGEAHEQWVLFLLDPSNNAIEIKHFTRIPSATWV